MTQPLTGITGFRRILTRLGRKKSIPTLRLSVQVDHGVPGSHLIWDIENTGDPPVTLTKLIVHGEKGITSTVPLGLPHVLAPTDHLVLPTDIDWTLLRAKSIAAVDVDGREYAAPRRELAAIRRRMRDIIDRPAERLSAVEFLSGAANLAFGVALLGLGFFMLLYVIATG